MFLVKLEPMGRLPRAIDDGLVYHALNRGNNSAVVFKDDDDHVAFLEALALAKQRYPFELLGYCLMPNHFHLLVRPEAGQSISRILQSLTVAHTAHFHRRHHSTGHVWQGRFKSPVIQEDALTCRLLTSKRILCVPKWWPSRADYRWSSYPSRRVARQIHC